MMKNSIKKLKPHHVILALATGGIVISAMNSAPPLFSSLDNFVLFAQEEIKLEQGVQVSSGDLGSNGKIEIEKDAIINGNLFADEITIDKNTTINGNVSFNKLKTEKDTQILGTQTNPVQLPIANLPDIPGFQVGTQDFKFEGQSNTLAAGNYRDILIEKDSRFVLSGGTYNLRKLELKDNATLIFSVPTILNVQFKLKGQKHVSILPGQNLKPTDLVINYLGIKPENEKDQKEDDGDEINQLLDNQEKKDNQDGKIGRPIVFGKESFLNFKLLAPDAKVNFKDNITFRGQVLAKEIEVGEGSVLSRKESFNGRDDLSKVVISNGNKFFVNEILVKLNDSATIIDASGVAATVNGRVIGALPQVNIYKIQVLVTTIDELNIAMQKLSGLTPLVQGVMNNFLPK